MGVRREPPSDPRARDSSSERSSVERRIEIVHESLLTKWPRLVHWQTQDAEGAQLRDELRQAAQVWDQHGRSPDLVWTGTAFREYRVWRERYPGGLSAVETEFTQAMEVGDRRRHRRRRTTIVTLLAAAAVVAVGSLLLWQRAESARKHAEASRLVAIAEHELAIDPTAALAYAIQSLEVADTEAGRLLALRALEQVPLARIARGSVFGPYAPTLTSAGTPDRGASFFPKDVAFSASGEWLATGSFVRAEVLHRDGQRRVVLGEYRSAGEESLEVRFAPRSDVVVSNLRGEVGVWSIPDARELRREQFEEGPSRLLMADGGFLTVTQAGETTAIRQWPIDTGESRLLGRSDRLGPFDAARGTIAFARGSSLYLTSFASWDAEPRPWAEHPTEIVDVALGRDARLVAASDRSGAIRIWSTADRRATPQRVLDAEGTPWLRFGPAATWLSARGVVDGHPTIRLWNLRGVPGAEPIALRRAGSPQVNGLSFDPVGGWLASAHTLEVALWWIGDDYPITIRGEAPGSTLGFTPDGRSLIASFTDGTVRLWPLDGDRAAEARVLLRDGPRFPMLAIDPSGRNVAVAGEKGQIHLLSLGGGPARRLEGFSQRVRVGAIGFDREGRLLAAGAALGPAEEKVVRVFDLETGSVRVLGPVPGAGNGFVGGSEGTRTVLFEGRDRILVSVYSTGLVSFDLRSGAASILAPEPCAWALVNHSANGGVGGTGDCRPEAEWKLIRFRFDGSPVEELDTHGPDRGWTAAAFDPSDRLLATGNPEGIVRVGPASGQEPHLLLGHTSRVRNLAFSPDGSSLAAIAVDGTIRIWRVPDMAQRPLHTLPLNSLLTRLRTHTNLRAVPDPTTASEYKLEIGPFPGWASPPEW